MVSLYEELGVQNNASEDEVKKAYRTLARKYHPDKARDEKAAEENASKIQKINRAYEVLSDPKKKRVYDRFGYEGLTLLEKESSEFVNILLFSTSPYFIFSVAAVVFLFVSLLIIAAAFLNVRMEQDVSWSWVVVFIPLWLASLIYLFFVLTSLVIRVKLSKAIAKDAQTKAFEDEPDSPISTKNAPSVSLLDILAVISTVSLIVFLVLLPFALNDNDVFSATFTWIIVFVPLLFSMALSFICSFPTLLPSVYKAKHVEKNTEFTKIFNDEENQSHQPNEDEDLIPTPPPYEFHFGLGYVGFLIRAVLWKVTFFCTALLMMTQLSFSQNYGANPDQPQDDGLLFDWYIVAIPLFAAYTLDFVCKLIEMIFGRHYETPAILRPSFPKPSISCGSVVGFCCYLIVLGLLIFYVVAWSSFLNGPDPAKATDLWIPVYVVLSLVFVGVCICFCLASCLTLGLSASANLDQDQPQDPSDISAQFSATHDISSQQHHHHDADGGSAHSHHPPLLLTQ